MNYKQTHNLMKKAVPLARKMEGDWNIRMSIALRGVTIDHLLGLPFSKDTINRLLQKGVSYRRICKNYGVYHRDVTAILQ
ncbi:hypothetical protein HB911_12130 [Listeria booriae]|uniref:hypothetical protein n=1 Tax=Listeria booriae TaxID=1552123 RepID=UPI001628EE77|nr:hypothetical protein [Listeria booriae]MBC1559448.1 hypothetical protein [Listeria booriae]